MSLPLDDEESWITIDEGDKRCECRCHPSCKICCSSLDYWCGRAFNVFPDDGEDEERSGLIASKRKPGVHDVLLLPIG